MLQLHQPVWEMPPKQVSLPENHLHLWKAHVPTFLPHKETLQHFLSDVEMDRVKRFAFDNDRERYLVAHGLVRLCLAMYLDCQPSDIEMQRNAYGKPELVHHKLHYSLSYRGTEILLGIRRGHVVGVDIEKIDREVDYLSIAEQFFCKEEHDELKEMSMEDLRIAFFVCWTRKEAVMKATGRGFYYPINAFCISPDPQKRRIQYSSSLPDFANETDTVYTFMAAPGYIASAILIQENEPCQHYELSPKIIMQ